jgi:hypothetical protein
MYRELVGALWLIVAIAPALVHASTVELTLRDGRVSLVATDATPAQIFDAWSRAGGVAVINAERLPSTPVTMRLDDVPEEQALETVLRSVSGYLARRRVVADASRSLFDRIVILATPATARVTAPAPAPPARAAGTPTPVFPQAPAIQEAPRPDAAAAGQPVAEPAGIPQGPGVVRLVGPDGQPMEDDQVGAPPPPATPSGGVDAPNAPPQGAPPGFVPPAAPPPPGAGTAAPIGAPAPGMVVPAPAPSNRTQP